MNIKQAAVAAAVAGAMLAAPAMANAVPVHVDSGLAAHQAAALATVDQLMIELINRARQNPDAEAQRLARLVAAEAAQLAALKADQAAIAAAHTDQAISMAALSAANTAAGSREQYELLQVSSQIQTGTDKLAAAGAAVIVAAEALPPRTNENSLRGPLLGLVIEVGMENRVYVDETALLFALPAAPSEAQNRALLERVDADIVASHVDISRAAADLAAAQRALAALQHHA